MKDDSVTRDEAGSPHNVGKSSGKRGEEAGKEKGAKGKESQGK